MDFKEVKTDKAPAAIGPYSQAVISGEFVFTSGQIPIEPKSGALIQGGIEEQTKQVINNLKAVLNAAGVSLTDVVKTTCFIKDMNDFTRFNEVYAGFFSAPFPARSCVEAARLPKDVLVEIEAVAAIR